MAIHITTVEQLRKDLLPTCHLRFSSLEACAQELVDIITSTALVNSPNPPSPREPTQNSPSNLPRPTGPATTPARAPPRLQPPDAQSNITPTPKAISLLNAPQSTTPASIPISSLPPSNLLAPETTPAKAFP